MVTRAQLEALDPTVIAEAIDMPVSRWRHNCHVVSLAIVTSDLFTPGTCRVARGTAHGVGGQHSWVCFGDPYDEKHLVLDCTLWSYTDAPTVYVGQARRQPHVPHGSGSHWDVGIPPSDGEKDVTPAELNDEPLIDLFRRHIDGPLSMRWWAGFLAGPTRGWPASEWLPIIAADPLLHGLIPIDVLGMCTDLNPDDMYMHPEDPRVVSARGAVLRP